MFAQLISTLKKSPKTIVFTEGTDHRILEASARLLSGNFLKPVLVGNPDEIADAAEDIGFNIRGAEIIDPENYDGMDEMVDKMVELRKGKMTADECRAALKKSNYFGTMLVKMGKADCLLGGATYSTADTVRPALQLIKTKPGNKIVSSCFIMVRPAASGENEVLAMADCAINIKPNEDELVEICKETVSCAKIFGVDPKVAFLSYSTLGSGKGEDVDKMRNACEKAKALMPDTPIGGEFQFDAAVSPAVAKTKHITDAVGGHANTFIFPDINAGNIGYKIAQLLKNTEERKTPLQVSLDQFGRKLSIIILVICAVLFGVSVLWRHENVMNAFLFAVALAVAAIPEALSSIVTIVLSFGTRKMAKENAIIRHLQAVEGLGSVSVICSDKTGTLTQNRMTVRKLYTGGEVIDAKDADFRDPLQEPLLRTALLCSDAVISGDTEIGDPTETALVRLGETNGFDEDLVRDRWPRLTEIPFDSDRKMMSTVHKLAGGLMLVTKGATDVLLDRCVVTPEERARIEQVNEQFSNEGLRVLAFACRSVDSTAITLADENGLTFLGLIAMMDPPREESKAAVAECIRAGIRPIMITGDHKITAAAIAREIGILRDKSGAKRS